MRLTTGDVYMVEIFSCTAIGQWGIMTKPDSESFVRLGCTWILGPALNMNGFREDTEQELKSGILWTWVKLVVQITPIRMHWCACAHMHAHLFNEMWIREYVDLEPINTTWRWSKIVELVLVAETNARASAYGFCGWVGFECRSCQLVESVPSPYESELNDANDYFRMTCHAAFGNQPDLLPFSIKG